jgi:UDP-glucose 4-epimerase
MRILVTGGAGYIGSVAAHALIEQGFDVSILDDLSSGFVENIPSSARFVEGSLLDQMSVIKALDGCEAVLHFAGKSIVSESVKYPELYQRINVDGSKILLSQMLQKDIKKIVFSSSAATYGNLGEFPIKEDSVTIPTNPYGYTKLRIEELIKLESEESGLSAISLRYFNVAGAKKIKSGWLVENHLPETHLIPNVLKSSIENPVSVFGTDWPTTDGTCIRDYVHVVDLIEAHLKALDTLVSPGHEIFNLGSGCGFSVRDVLSAAGEVLGYAIPFNEAPRRDGDPAILVADVTKARDILNWTPKKDLNDMVSDTFLASNT